MKKKAVINQKRGKASETEENMIKYCKSGCCYQLDKGWEPVELSEKPESVLAKPKSVKSTKKKKKENIIL